MNKLRVAMLSMAHVHANGYGDYVVKHPEAELVCIWDDDAGRRKDAAERFGVPVSDDIDKVCSQVDAVVIDGGTVQVMHGVDPGPQPIPYPLQQRRLSRGEAGGVHQGPRRFVDGQVPGVDPEQVQGIGDRAPLAAAPDPGEIPFCGGRD